MSEIPLCEVCGKRPILFHNSKPMKLCVVCAWERLIKALRYAKSRWYWERGRDEDRIW